MLVFTAASSVPAPDYGLFVLQTVGALGVIAVAAWGAVRFFSKRSVFGRSGTRLRSLERLALDPRRSIHLVEADGETLLIGVSEQSVTLLKTLSPGKNGETRAELDTQKEREA
jgi:flagellar biosynthetic protein FliO